MIPLLPLLGPFAEDKGTAYKLTSVVALRCQQPGAAEYKSQLHLLGKQRRFDQSRFFIGAHTGTGMLRSEGLYTTFKIRVAQAHCS